MENFINYAPIIIVVLMFFIQERIFVTPEQLEKKHREILKEVLTNVYRTAQQLQKIHDSYWQGRTLIISSGWRSTRNNKNCGGAAKSRHLYGKAIDFNLGLPTIKQDFEIMQKHWKGYVLFEGTWIHVQMD